MALIAGLVAAFPLAGCASGDKTDEGDRRSKGAAAVWDLPSRPEPGIRAAMNGLFKGEGVRAAAEDELVFRCMKARGFRYIKPAPSGPARDVNPMMPTREEYGISLDEAQRYGYRVKETLADTPRDIDQTTGLSPAQKQAWGEAFEGPESAPRVRVKTADGSVVEESGEGCLAEARIKVYGSLQKMMQLQQLAGNLPALARQRATNDPVMKRLNATWSSCMDSKGYGGLANPSKAREMAGDFHHKLSAVEAAQKEIKLAVADTQCENASNYASQRRLLEDRYYTAGLRHYQSEIASIREMNEETLNNARRVLRG